ncbi:DUF922 domain-containing Zn-dependent protease [Aestuariibacter halophilus]|uniref:DUF922 domain-containing Zn-dependent protease n=1 Tax=Fluctibacter halophilus TaxID=226011 RepID=A0ABS8G5K6_9ALTE|nr:DUF922 domain-containing protein [Aestuariibacter halophilus]MCC2615845.1 DUF922 domain-containing Zn-dependent protease [Aestuariibacter halophilus]
MSLFFRTCCVALTVLSSPHAVADVRLDTRTQHYDIYPTSAADIRLQLRKHSPIIDQQQSFHGQTQWHLVPDFRWREYGNACRFHHINVTLTGAYVLPRLANTSETDADTRETFARYYQALRVHEEGHQALWLEAGQRIETLLQNMHGQQGCKALTEQATQQIHQIIDEYHQRNGEYDTTTGHGRTQGAAIR